jgi:hypothetical protein
VQLLRENLAEIDRAQALLAERVYVNQTAGVVMRRIAVGIVGLVLAIGVGPMNAGASAAPSARVSPGGALRDGREVTVHWSGMLAPKHGKTVQFLQVAECNRAFTIENASEQTYVQNCDEYHAQMSTHRGFYEATAHVSEVGLASVPCNGAGTCELAVVAGHTDAEFHLHIERVAVAPIDFRS